MKNSSCMHVGGKEKHLIFVVYTQSFNDPVYEILKIHKVELIRSEKVYF
jgi:hypothetical protein